MTAEHSPQQVQSDPRHWSLASRPLAALLLTLVVLAALLLRVLGLDAAPLGLAHHEAQVALFAHDMGRNNLHLLPDSTEPGAREPLFAWWLKLSGSIGGWSIAAARMASALSGVVLALACALWYRRALGSPWAIAGGLLVATSAWQLVLSRQVSAGMLGAALLSLGLWCLWQGSYARAQTACTTWWSIAALCCALAGYAYAPFALLVPLFALCAVLLAWHARRAGGDSGWFAAGFALAVLLAISAPLALQALADVDAFWSRIEHSPIAAGPPAGQPDTLGNAIITTLQHVVAPANGAATAHTRLHERGLLDPLLALWCVAGVGAALWHIRRPLAQVTLAWLSGCLLLAVLVAPGHPEVLLAATPAIVLLPLLAAHAILEHIATSSRRAQRAALGLFAASLLVSVAWSQHAYWRVWVPSNEVYAAFNADLREALQTTERLPATTDPVYVSTWDRGHVVRYLLLGTDTSRAYHAIDGRTQVLVPTTGGAYLLDLRATPVDPALLALVAGADERPVATGSAPDGRPGWAIWRVAQPARERLPYTVPTIRFPNRIQLVGYSVVPDLGDIEVTGQLPDPPRVVVTLVWNVPAAGFAHQAVARLIPVGPLPDPASIETASAWLVPPLPPTDGSGRQLVVMRLIVVVPETPDLVVDVEAGLRGIDGSPRAPYGPPAVISGDHAFLNRIQYRIDTR
jgi:4-amino-4-deoxy-L-arabinose transferase-like glycosyltransferase